ncbi:MAG: hypothetical protein ACE5PV_06860, partial [Candidatus Poribacteria bacterium]
MSTREIYARTRKRLRRPNFLLVNCSSVSAMLTEGIDLSVFLSLVVQWSFLGKREFGKYRLMKGDLATNYK